MIDFTNELRKHIHAAMVAGKGTRDLCGPEGLTTEGFVAEITRRIEEHQAIGTVEQPVKADKRLRRNFKVDKEAVQRMFGEYDKDSNGMIDLDEFTSLLVDLDIAPKDPLAKHAATTP